MLDFRGLLRSLAKCAGKGEQKVASVFGVNAAASHQAVLHLREGAPGIPVWLFTTVAPLPETEALCERVYLNRSSLALVIGAQRHLWTRWVAISVGTWIGEGPRAVRFAPFLMPPFRVLILNRDGGFFSGTPANILVHGTRAGWDAVQLAARRFRESLHAAREAVHNARVHAREALHDALSRTGWRFHALRVRMTDLTRGIKKVSLATGLHVTASLLQWLANPHIALFKRLHGTQPLALDVEASKGDEVICFRQEGPDWKPEEIEKLARSSDARWLLWHTGGADPVPDARSLFIDRRTFAASRQMHFRGWKTVVAAAAPFRTLQPGEATRVLAPLSSSILVDRRKLLALGIPRCGMPGTAWLILFWKAAAAGWRSYSVGQAASAALPEQPEFPIQDTSFVLHVLADGSLRKLCPRQQELSRGNIAFAANSFALPEAPRERLKVLIVSPFLPYPLSHGGAVRIYNLCRELSDRVDFTLIAMREANDVVEYDKLHRVFREVYVVDKDERTAPHKDLPAQVSSSESRSLRALISQVAEKLMPDVLQVEYTHFAGLRECAPGVPAVLVEHDLTFSLYRQLAEANSNPESWREYERWRVFERKWLGVYEGVWTVSADDRLRAMEEGSRDPERTFTIANGVDLDRFQTDGDAEESSEIFYVGSFRHLPNIIGFEKLCDEIMPRVWAKNPQVRLRVVAGPEHERYWRQFGRKSDLTKLDARIVMHGFVENLQPLYERASVAAVPLEVSAGTNIKVLEAMACKRAIVSTPVGCAGLGLQDGYNVLIREGQEQFADALCTLLADGPLRSRIGARARRTVEEEFGWQAIAGRAYESYLALAGQPSRSTAGERRLTTLHG